MNEERTRRCFVAVKVSERVHHALEIAQVDLRDYLPREIAEAWQSEEAGFHITLRFLGDMTREQLARFQLIDYLKESAPEALGLRAFELKWGAVDVFCNDRGSPRVLYAPVVGDKFTLYYSEGLPVEGPVQSACPCPRRASPSIHTSRWAGSTGILPQRKADISKMLSAVLMDV